RIGRRRLIDRLEAGRDGFSLRVAHARQSTEGTADAYGSTVQLVVLVLFVVIVLVGLDGTHLAELPLVPSAHELLDRRVELGGRDAGRRVAEVALHPHAQLLDGVLVAAHALDLARDV